MRLLGPGDRIDRYTIEALIGEGGMGRVYRAYDERLDRLVAVKIVAQGGAVGENIEAKKRLVREARAASKLDHPNVVSVFDVGETAEGPYIVMELVPGPSLRELIDVDAASQGDRVRILRDAANALVAAHDAGIVHRDVKPENVIVRPDGRVKVLDFGIARAVPCDALAPAAAGPNLPTLTQDGTVLGTPRYMAPEQIKGGIVDGRSDQFSWAVTAYELFEGRPPFRGADAMAVMAAVLTESAPPLEKAGIPLGAIVLRALHKDPAQRFSTMREVVAALEAIIERAIEPPARLSPAPLPPASPPSPHPAHGSEPPVSPTNPTLRASTARPPTPPQLSRRYTALELEEIFDRALAVQRSGYAFDDLAAAGREIGIDGHSLEQAMNQLERRGAVAPRPQRRTKSLRGFYRHMGIWLAVSFGLFLMNVFDPTSVWWFQWTMIPWGIGIGIHAVMAFTRGAPDKQPLGRHSHDPILEGDALRVAEYLGTEPRLERVRIGRGSRFDGDDQAENEMQAEESDDRRASKQRKTRQ